VSVTNTWRIAEPDQFGASVLLTAEQLGILPLAVEKDYWAAKHCAPSAEAIRARWSSRVELAWRS